MFKVKKQKLLLIAEIVWMIAGFNVTRLGILAYKLVNKKTYLYVLSIVIFLIFGRLFYKMTKKHTKRILNYEEYRQFWNFFDLKSYIIMFFMMGGGIALREFKLVSNNFIAFFYTGLGIALGFAGTVFIKNYIHQKKYKKM